MKLSLAEIRVAELIQLFGFIFVFAGLWLNWRAQRAQTAITFFSRFDEIITSDKSNLFWVDARVRRSLTSDALKTARRYFNLCSEEFNLKQRRYIPGKIWDIWLRGIEGVLRDKLWQDGWRKIRREYDYYPEFVEFVDDIAKRAPGHPV